MKTTCKLPVPLLLTLLLVTSGLAHADRQSQAADAGLVDLHLLHSLHAQLPDPPPEPHPADPTLRDGECWPGFGRAGTNGTVTCALKLDDHLIVGGQFTRAGDSVVSNIARWDGESWSELSGGVNGIVRALVQYEGKLIVGGGFTAADGQPANNIAAWDGDSWSTLGTGLNDQVSVVAVYENRLIAGGFFTAAGSSPTPYVAYWDGSAWHALGGGTDGWVTDLLVYGGNLVAGGWFTAAGEARAHFIASWDGTAWAPLGGGAKDPVTGLGIYRGDLIAGGSFLEIGTVQANRVARWDGSSWSPLGGGIPSPHSSIWVTALAAFQDELYVGGYFHEAGGTAANHLARWNGVSWQQVAAGMTSSVLSLTVDDDVLVVAGYFEGTLDGGIYNNIAVWDGDEFHGLGAGADGPVWALAGHAGALVASGGFMHAGGTPCSKVAAWSDTWWSPLGLGLEPSPLPGRVRALCSYGELLVAGGEFTYTGTGQEAIAIASWSGQEWEEFGGGMNNSVGAVCTYNGDLIVAGRFTRAGNVNAQHIARWDGQQWHPLETGTDDDVYALLVHNDKLIVGGAFVHAGGILMDHIAMWDGVEWRCMVEGVNGPVYALGSYEGYVIAGGDFTEASGVPVNHVARCERELWRWSGIGGGVSGGSTPRVRALKEYGDYLYVGGRFQYAGETPAANGAYWDGHAWHPLGSGFDDEVIALTEHQGQVYAGGYFTHAGGVESLCIARFDPAALADAREDDPQSRRTRLHLRAQGSDGAIRVWYELPAAGAVRFSLYDLLGRRVNAMERSHEGVGRHAASWSPAGPMGCHLSSGMYLLRVTAGDAEDATKVVMIR